MSHPSQPSPRRDGFHEAQRLGARGARPSGGWLPRALVLLALASSGWAETVRVATWSLAAPAGAPEGAEPRLNEATQALKKLNPDVILLESVRDWQTCRALAQALKPADYSVLVCSSFRNGGAATSAPPQVAILSKHKGYFSWSEPWRVGTEPVVPGGFAFAAIQFPKHRVGFFAAHVDPQAAGPNAAPAVQVALSRQWGQTLDSFKSWVSNRLEAIVAADGEFAPDSSEAVATTRFLSGPLSGAVTLPAHPESPQASSGAALVRVAADAKSVPGVVLVGPQVACALDLDAPKAPVAQATPPKALAGPMAPKPAATAPKSQPAVAPPSPRSASNRAYLFPGAALAALLLVGWFWARRRRVRSAAIPVLPPGQGVSSYTLVVSEPGVASPTVPGAAQAPIPQRVAPHAAPAGKASPVEPWPPGPVLLPPDLQRAAAQDSEGLRQHLAHWLKQKLVQRLLSDRSELLKAQQAATGKLLSLEERLARLELQLQQQNQAYEQRIMELDRELAAAKEENRELIRARIAQVKAEMEVARARLIAQARVGER